MSNSSAGFASAARRVLPILDWMPAYRREWLLPDVFAGVALWAVMVPEGMAYSSIVGVPPIMGLFQSFRDWWPMRCSGPHASSLSDLTRPPV